MILIRFIAARVRKTFHELHLVTPSLLFLPANQVSVGYGDKIGGLNMKMMMYIYSEFPLVEIFGADGRASLAL